MELDLREDHLRHGYTLTFCDNTLYHSGVKGQKWGVRRYQNEDGSLTSQGEARYNNERKQKISRNVKIGATVAASVLAAYGVHKVINNPEVISAGKNAVSKMMSAMDTGKLSESVKSSTEYKLAKGAVKAAKPVVSTTGKVIKKIGSDDTTKTITGIGTMAGTAALLKQQRNELRDIKKTEGTNFDKTVKYIQKTSDMGANVSNLAKGPKGQPAGVNNSQNGNKNGNKNSSSNSLLKQTRDLKSVVGDPKGMFGAEDEKNYQNLFRNNPTDDQRAIIKAMRKNGYSVEQIKSYVYHSGIGCGEMYRIGYHSDELYHHGIKGQKWGIRRYQNKDGSLTYAGRKHALKERRNSEYDAHETKHEEAVSAINRKHGQLGNNYEGSNRRMGFREKRAYNKEIKKAWNDYETAMDNSKKAYKSELKSAKPLAYRDKLAYKAGKKAESASEEAKKAREAVNDLKKNGTKSTAYQEWKYSKDYERAQEYERKNSYTSPDGETYTKSYRTSGQRFINDFFDSYDSESTVKMLTESYQGDYEYYSRKSKKYTEANRKLMNMPVSSLTTKKDIKKVYKGK